MQRVAKVLLASAVVAVSGTQASSKAQVWLRAHAAPNQDELADLKTENPDAYALVKALLTKRSLGLLDSKHPSASFAPARQEAPVLQGAEAFALSEQDQEAVSKKGSGAAVADDASVDLPYPSAPQHHDWLNWKPQDSAVDDDSMVKNVLGEVGNLVAHKSASLVTSGRDTGSALAADEEAFGGKLGVDVAVAAAAEHEIPPAKIASSPPVAPLVQAPDASASEGNSYLKNIDFGLKPDTFLKPAVKPVQSLASESVNYLSSFSWDDSKPTVQKQQQATPALADDSKPPVTLSSWLSR